MCLKLKEFEKDRIQWLYRTFCLSHLYEKSMKDLPLPMSKLKWYFFSNMFTLTKEKHGSQNIEDITGNHKYAEVLALDEVSNLFNIKYLTLRNCLIKSIPLFAINHKIVC